MKIKKTLMLFLGILVMLLPTIVDAVCSDHSAYDCPDGTCKVEGDACVDVYVGENVCEEENVKSALKVVGYFVYVAKILVPFIIIGFGIFDLVKAVTSGGTDMLGKQIKVLGIRVLIGLVIFFIPTIVSVIVDAADNFDSNESGFNTCLEYVIHPFLTRQQNGCAVYNSENSCNENNSCWWYSNQCVNSPCLSIDNDQSCNQAPACQWNTESKSCEKKLSSTEEKSCSSYSDSMACQLNGCNWNGIRGKCQELIPNGSTLSTTTTTFAYPEKIACEERQGYHWNYNSQQCEQDLGNTTEDSCSNYTEMECALQPGCTWALGGCRKISGIQ